MTSTPGSLPHPDHSPAWVWDRFRTMAPVAVYVLCWFHLAAGRITLPVFGLTEVKIGENMENLVPALLIARWLDRRKKTIPLLQAVRPYRSGLFLIVAGLVLAWIHFPSTDTLEDAVRWVGRVLCALFLVEWAVDRHRSNDSVWIYAFLAGLAWLFVWTPWGQLGNPDLEGPFPHRNLEAAFCLLSLPILAWIFGGMGKTKPWLPGLGGLLILVCLAFIVLSKSRAGTLGVGAAFLSFLYFSPQGQLWSRQRLVRIGIPLIVFAAGVAGAYLWPRFMEIKGEFGNPYHRSRSSIWSAAVSGWESPERWLFGIGMEDSFDRVLLESPTGNLNYRYRRAHYPHSLYFQWMYWGGITALLGWFVLYSDMLAEGKGRPKSWAERLWMACLIGFAFLELFESALRDQRVATLFWADLFFLACLRRGWFELTLETVPGSENPS